MKIPNLPSRFENLKLSRDSIYTRDELELLKAFIFQVKKPTKHIKKMIRTMKASNSGAFMILMGESGIGKTTFLNTLPLYVENLEVRSIYNNKLNEELDNIRERNHPRIIILENRETFETLSTNQLEIEIHSINKFIRSDEGRDTIIVWPCNGEEMTKEIIQFAGHIGGESIFRGDTILEYEGPSRDRFVSILKNTYEFFNEYDISEIGYSDKQIENILNNMDKKCTIGDFLEGVRTELLNDYDRIEDAKDYMDDSFSLILCVIAGNNPKGEIEYLTKGDYSLIDIDRLYSSTNSNIKTTIGERKCVCSMMAKEINYKIVSIDWQDVLEILRIKLKSEDDDTKKLENYLRDKCNGFKLGKSQKQLNILETMNLTRGIKGLQYKRKNSCEKLIRKEEMFKAVLKLAEDNDRIINKKICEAMKENGLIEVGRVEENYGDVYQIRSDMLCSIPGKYFRVEFMWRETASAANIAEYALNKLYKYCRAMRII